MHIIIRSDANAVKLVKNLVRQSDAIREGARCLKLRANEPEGRDKQVQDLNAAVGQLQRDVAHAIEVIPQATADRVVHRRVALKCFTCAEVALRVALQSAHSALESVNDAMSRELKFRFFLNVTWP